MQNGTWFRFEGNSYIKTLDDAKKIVNNKMNCRQIDMRFAQQKNKKRRY